MVIESVVRVVNIKNVLHKNLKCVTFDLWPLPQGWYIIWKVKMIDIDI